jgi:hypothetical protein
MRTTPPLVNVLRFATSIRPKTDHVSNFYKLTRKKLQHALQEHARGPVRQRTAAY